MQFDINTTSLCAALAGGVLVMVLMNKSASSSSGGGYVHSTRDNQTTHTYNIGPLRADPRLQTLDRRIPGVSLYPVADRLGASQLAAVGGYDRPIRLNSRNLDALDYF